MENDIIKTLLTGQFESNIRDTDPSYSGFVVDYRGPILNDLINISLESTMEAPTANQKLYPVYVILSHSGSALANIIKKVTGDTFSHAALCIDKSFKTFYSFGSKRSDRKEDSIMDVPEGGFVIEHPDDEFYSTRPNMPYAIYCVFVTSKAYKAMKTKLQWFIDNKNKLKYYFKGLIKIWFKQPSENNTKFFCSGFVADILQAGGYATDRSYSLYKPQDLSTLPMSYLVGQGNGYHSININQIQKNTDKARIKYIKELNRR